MTIVFVARVRVCGVDSIGALILAPFVLVENMNIHFLLEYLQRILVCHQVVNRADSFVSDGVKTSDKENKYILYEVTVTLVGLALNEDVNHTSWLV